MINKAGESILAKPATCKLLSIILLGQPLILLDTYKSLQIFFQSGRKKDLYQPSKSFLFKTFLLSFFSAYKKGRHTGLPLVN